MSTLIIIQFDVIYCKKVRSQKPLSDAHAYAATEISGSKDVLHLLTAMSAMPNTDDAPLSTTAVSVSVSVSGAFPISISSISAAAFSAYLSCPWQQFAMDIHSEQVSELIVARDATSAKNVTRRCI